MTDGGASKLAIWSDHDLPREEGERSFSVGPLDLRVRWAEDEVWIAHARRTDAALPGRRVEPVPTAPSEWAARGRGGRAGGDATEEWARWAVPDGGRRLRLSPVFPDRPLVLEPEQPFHLLQGATARIYVRVPLWVRVEHLGRREAVLTEVPTTPLSDTWFGDPVEGELAYYLPTSARRALSPELFDAHRVICPLQLSNPSQDDLLVEKIALRVAHLSVYRSDEELWADETQARYQGEAAGSSTLRMSGEPPEEAGGAERLSPPRTPVDRSLTARTFARLRHVPGFGLSS